MPDATTEQVREVAIALKQRVFGEYNNVNPLYQEITTWVLDGIDGELPSIGVLKGAILSWEDYEKETLRLLPDVRAVKYSEGEAVPVPPASSGAGLDPAIFDVEHDVETGEHTNLPEISSSFAFLADVKAVDTNGGTFTTGEWRTRDLNTVVQDVDNLCTLSNHQFTLQPGVYVIRAASPAYMVARHQIRLYNVTLSAVECYGISAYTYQANNVQTPSFLESLVTITGAAQSFEIQHRGQVTRNNDGFGLNSVWDDAIFTTVTIQEV